MNPTDTALSYGVSGGLQSWNGHTWVSKGDWAGSLDQWGGFGRVSQGSGAVPAIRLGAAAHSVGTVEYLEIPSLDVGWYRLEIATASGLFEVAADAPLAPPVSNPTTFTATPVLLPPEGGQLGLVGFPPRTGVQTLEQVMQFNQQLAKSVVIERFQDGSWIKVATLAVQPSSDPHAYPAQVAVSVPVLSPGSYRIVRHSPTLGDLEREIWVIEPPEGIQLNRSA